MQSPIKPEDLLRWTWQIYPNRTDSDEAVFANVHPHLSEEASRESKAMQLFQKLSLFKEKKLSASNGESAELLHPLVIPMACVYAPLRSLNAFQESDLELHVKPWQCTKCGAALNAYCEREQDKNDGHVSRWVCVFCRSVNMYQGDSIAEPLSTCPADVQQYAIPESAPRSPIEIHCFIVDVSINAQALGDIAEQLLGAIQLLPPDAHIALITYAEMVCIWELTDSGFTRCVALPADRYLTETEICRYLGMAPGTCASMLSSKYLVPLTDADFMLTSVLQDIIPREGGGSGSSPRPKRCTGSAMHITTSFLSALLCPHVKAAGNTQNQCLNAYCVEMHVFIGGRITKGLGMQVEAKKDFLAGAKDVAAKGLQLGTESNDTDEFLSRMERFFDSVSCVTLNLFVCSLDTAGLEKFEPFASQSGGTVFLHESFGSENFEETLRRHFVENYQNRTVFDVSHAIYSSSETFVAGCIGPCKRLPRPQGLGPVRLRSASFNDESTLTLYFDSKPVQFNAFAQQSNQVDWNCHASRVFQFHTTFTTRSGERIVRITTARKGVGPFIQKDMRSVSFYKESGGFDQSTAFIVVAKYIAQCIQQSTLGVLKARRFGLKSLSDIKTSERKEHSNKEIFPAVKAFTEGILISFYRMFASNVSEPPVNFDAFPRLCYQLLRSDIFQNFNSSIDEQHFRFSHLSRQDVDNATRMIVPTLTRFACDTVENLKGIAVPLDSRLLQKDTICLIDAYFEVILYFGFSAHQWKQNKFHMNPEYSAFAELLHNVEDRFELLQKQYKTAPFLIRCVEGDSKSRFASQLMSETVPPYSASSGGGNDERNSLGAFLTACRQRAFGSRR